MTQAEFDDYRMSLLYYFGENCWNMVKKIEYGMDYYNDFYGLILCRGWIKIMNEYVLVVQGTSPDRNFYTQQQMYELSQKLNIYLNLNYDLNFYLTT
jgi:hypothetical protein